MILDKIENISFYRGIHKRFETALNYIKNTNFHELPSGNYDIEGNDIYAIVKECQTKEAQEDVDLLERHINYVDIHYVFEGSEQMGIGTLMNQKPVKAYDEKDDYSLYKEPYSLITIGKGMFTIFFPDDLHIPELKLNEISTVKKVIVKVKI